MRTLLIIALSVLAASLVYQFLICPKLCLDSSKPYATNRTNDVIPATNIFFKNFPSGTLIEHRHLHDGILSTGTFNPETPFLPVVLVNDNQFEYRITGENNYNTLAWKFNLINRKLLAFVSSMDITYSNTDNPCMDEAAIRNVKLELGDKFRERLETAGFCIQGLKVCETGNETNNCATLQNGSYAITVTNNNNQNVCKANGLTIRCIEGKLLGRLTLDDPDDLNIKVILGDMLDKELRFPRSSNPDSTVLIQ